LVELQQDVENMRSLVDHLLLLAQDHAPTKLVEVDLPALANAAVDAAREARPGALLTADLAPDTPPVRGDPLLLTQLLTNLLENAAYHGGGAPTELACWRGPGGGAVLRVSDSGPGVAAAEVARLGEPFYRPDPARGRAAPSGHQGSGLGLAIVKRVVEWHGAAWRIESAPGEGFSVTVEFLPA
jgi:signal transduction histidine kinase